MSQFGLKGSSCPIPDLPVDFSQDSFKLCLFSIAFNPIFWNIVARAEYKTHVLTKIALGNRKIGCYLLALTIFTLGLVRDHIYQLALQDQPIAPVMDNEYVKAAGAAIFLTGSVLVLTSMWALGVTGTYLGDYFGILMDDRVTSFPFNVTNNPMYNGSCLSFLGTALWYGRPAGVVLTLFVHFMYSIALKFEEPFTAMIYAKRDEERAKKAN